MGAVSAGLAQLLARFKGQYTPSAWRYLTTDMITGRVLGDWLPLTVQNFSRQINTSGSFTGALNLTAASPAQNAANLQAILPRRSVLWAFQDNVPVWNGPIWDWQPTSVIGSPVQFQGATMESILQHRVVDQTFNFVEMDVFDMFRALVQFAFSKTPNGFVAGVTYSPAMSGITDTITFDGTQYQYVSDAISTLITNYEIEYSFRPYADPRGNLFTSVDLGCPYLGQSLAESGLAFSMPGNLLDYQFIATGSSSANKVIATGAVSDGAGTYVDGVFVPDYYAGTAIDEADIAAGYPLSEFVAQPQGAIYNSNQQMTNYAGGYLPSVTDTQLTPVLVLAPGALPQLKNIILGSWADVALTSAMHPSLAAGVPGFAGTGRVVGWTAYPPGQGQTEYAWINMGGMVLSP
ncbi:MAG: hypothetical protein ACRDP5_28365 [Streptosporangiaceae bacterium]